jgi:virginiamycin B lyase
MKELGSRQLADQPVKRLRVRCRMSDRSNRVVLPAFACASLIFGMPRLLTAQAPIFNEYSIPAIPVINTGPGAISAGPDGALWFSEEGNGGSGTNGLIGRITTAGAITLYPIPSGADATSITAGPDGAVWFTEDSLSGPKIGRITTAGVISEYDLPLQGGQMPRSIIAAPDGALWYAAFAGRIGRISTSGVVTEYVLTAGPGPDANSIAAGPDAGTSHAALMSR